MTSDYSVTHTLHPSGTHHPPTRGALAVCGRGLSLLEKQVLLASNGERAGTLLNIYSVWDRPTTKTAPAQTLEVQGLYSEGCCLSSDMHIHYS